MNNDITIIPDRSFFRLPLVQGTLKLTRSTLDSYSRFRKPRRCYPYVRSRIISVQNNTLIISVKIENEDEETVYLKVTETDLLVSCSVDTDKTYLGRHAYFLLDNYLNFYHEKDMGYLYWPDFFDSTGKSKFLRTENKDGRFEIKLKKRYPFFYRPGTVLPQVSDRCHVRTAEVAGHFVIDKPIKQARAIAYCLLDPLNFHVYDREHSELTLLVPIKAKPNLGGTSLKSMISYLSPGDGYESGTNGADQDVLNSICSDMWRNTLFYRSKDIGSSLPPKRHVERNICLFRLWEQAFPLLTGQKFACYQPLYDLRYIKGKPIKKHISSCMFLPEIPTLKFYLKDRGDYYSLEIKFAIGRKVFNFANHFKTHYFAASDVDPKRFYLLGSPQDAEIVSFFAKINFNLPVLKSHYNNSFKVFVDRINNIYGVIGI